MPKHDLTAFAAGLAILALAACADPLPAGEVTAAIETGRVAGRGDAADDPAVWRAADPAQSLVFGTDKDNGLYVYTLDGAQHAYLPEGRLNNVDIATDFALSGRMVDIAIASDRSNTGLAAFLIDPATREVSYAGAVPVAGVAEPYGVCLYRSRADGELYAFLSDKEPGTYVQLRLGWSMDGLTAEEVRRIPLGTIAEGCVADERTGTLYMNEENIAVWTVGAEPSDPAEPQRLADVDGRVIVADAEGAALLPRGETGGWLVVSSQGDNAYAVFDLESRAFVTRFRIADGALDGVTHTDGLDIHAQALGPDFPDGILVVQDDEDDAGGQNFKFVDLRQVIDLIEAAALASDREAD